MSAAGENENSDEEYYVDESFEEDSQSEVEEQEEEVEDEQVDEEELEVDEQEANTVLLEESDTQSESDVEAEFLRGNPHARRQQMVTGRSTGGFNRDRMMTYPSSSDDEESQVVITKTVAEVNQLSLCLDTAQDDEMPSVRTLMPGSAHAQTADDDDDDDVEEVYELEEVEEYEEEEELEEDDDGAQSDGTMASNHGRQEADEESDEDEATDVEVEQLEEDEPVVPVAKEKPPLPQEDLVSLVDASDNSSEYSVTTIGMAGAETDVTLADASPRFQKQQPDASTEPVTVMESKIEKEEHEKLPVAEPLMQLNNFLDSSETDDVQEPDEATVRYLEKQMTQMSEMIMKTFRINGGATNSQAFEQLARATELMQQHSRRREDSESEVTSITESALTSARTCGGEKSPMRMRYQRSQESIITRSSKIPRPKCRCPSESELREQEQEMGQSLGVDEELLDPGMQLGMGMEQGFLMDECGQGDGLMRHPPQGRPPAFNRRATSSTPSSFNSDGGQYPMNVSRSRCSNEKFNYKNLGRKSFTFTNVQVREIERQNQILLRKMMTVKPTATIKASTSSLKIGSNAPERQPPPAPRLTSAAVNRKKYQRQIDLDNDVLKRKLEAIGTRRSQFK
ncbi:protein hemingway [Drosophila kikkawai]|uniref:Protein hemingway n=1 Tax=Drosophila kikkawai TaxID=30033 RepID=A0A6P4JMP8_DROKI|nr:protein hemingway [Drosophila kikkawai]